MKKILVTGIGAIIGYGILRSLRLARTDVRLIGSDIYSDAVGQAWCDTFIRAPLTAEPAYQGWLEDVVLNHQVDLIIPGIEQDLYYFSNNREKIECLGCSIVLNTENLINLSYDKWKMYRELKIVSSDVTIPSYLDGEFYSLADELGLPFILKPRRGYASKGIVRVSTEEEFSRVRNRLGTDLMVQPIVGTDDKEYTVGVFGNGNGRISGSITMRRKLSVDGSTAKAWIESHPDLDHVILQLCTHFRPIGPTNFQFRKEGDNWMLLEINPRISSSTSLRAAFGYNESDMCIKYFLGHDRIEQPAIKSGFAARYIEDYVIYDRNNF